MKKNITTRQSPRQATKARHKPITIGMDLGEKTSRYWALNDGDDEESDDGKIRRRTRIAEVIVANARQVRLITHSTRKDDKLDARTGFAKASGERLPACDADSLAVETMEALPAGLKERLKPLFGADRPDRVSGNQTPDPDSWSGRMDRSDARVDGGRQRAV
jgi:hypothetical protein